ncbi:Amino acid permease 8, partial [Mucuna pruriens]
MFEGKIGRDPLDATLDYLKIKSEVLYVEKRRIRPSPTLCRNQSSRLHTGLGSIPIPAHDSSNSCRTPIRRLHLGTKTSDSIEGHDTYCKFSNNPYMIGFGVVQIFLSQAPNFHKLTWLSTFVVATSFGYAFIESGISLAVVISGKGEITRIFGARTT